jgi:intein/homing endonuclease
VNDNGEIVDSDYLINYSDGKKLKTVSWNFSNDKLVYSESEFFKTGKKKVYEIETTDGRKIRCSEDHKLFVKRRSWESNNKTTWKIFELKLKDIKKGDRLVCEKK